ncbi:hypothetical protein OM428_14540 [Enterococcus gallinarum]|nr:hypothetical protein [Enterococcus gallinarum]
MKQRQHSQKLILGGEVHNSTASSIAYMEEKVWDKIDKVAINTLFDTYLLGADRTTA